MTRLGKWSVALLLPQSLAACGPSTSPKGDTNAQVFGGGAALRGGSGGTLSGFQDGGRGSSSGMPSNSGGSYSDPRSGLGGAGTSQIGLGGRAVSSSTVGDIAGSAVVNSSLGGRESSASGGMTGVHAGGAAGTRAGTAGTGGRAGTVAFARDTLEPLRTYVFHELTSLAAEPQSWPVMSRNGQVVAFATGINNPKQVAVNVINADGTGQQEVDRYIPLCYCSGTVDVSADGQQVVSTESMQIRHVKLGGSATPVLAVDSNEISELRISADGARIFFLLRRDATVSGTSTRLERGIYTVNVDGTGLRQITGPTTMAVGLGVGADKIFPFSGCGRSLDVSTDGNHIAFAAAVSGMESVFSVNADGSGVRKLVDASGGFKHVDKLTLSGNGNLVGYHAYVADGVVEMDVIGFDGTGRLKLDTEPPAPLAGCSGTIRLTEDGSKLYVDEPSYLYNTDGTGALQLSIGVVAPPGGSPVKDGTPQGWMNADGTRFIYKNADNAGIPQLMLLELNPRSLGAAPVVSDPTFTPTMVTVAGLDGAVATVRATGTGIKTVGVKFASNGLPDVIDRGNGILFSDSGANGDDMKGDGIWSGKGFYGYYTPKPGARTVRFTVEATVDGKRHATVLEAGTVIVQ